MNKKPILLYHGSCPDGFGSAFSFWKKYKDEIEYKAMIHGDSIPECLRDRVIYFADFCFKKEEMKIICDNNKKVILIDHHKTAFEDMKNFSHKNLESIFDMNKSGAGLSWEFNFPNEPLPVLLQYIQDRDINNWLLPDGEAYLAAIDSHEFDFQVWNDLFEKSESKNGFRRIVNSGKIVVNFMKENVEHLKTKIFILNIKGINFPTVNTGIFWRNKLLNEIANEKDGFSAGYNYDGTFYNFSLRSNDKNGIMLDVSEIAEKFPGGGGHKGAAGFKVSSLDELK